MLGIGLFPLICYEMEIFFAFSIRTTSTCLKPLNIYAMHLLLLDREFQDLDIVIMGMQIYTQFRSRFGGDGVP